MHNDSVTQVAMTTLRCVSVLVSHKSLLKSFAAYILLFISISIIPPISVQATETSNSGKSPEQIMSRLKERLSLTEDQETKIQLIIAESFKKRSEILNNGGQDSKSEKSALQELRWLTDMQIGKVLTENQMREYQELREEESEKKTQHNDMQHGRGMRTGGMRGF